MLNLNGRRVFLAVGVTDMRKAVNTLGILVENQLDGELFSGDVFGFCNRNENIVKLLWWDRNGFCLFQKRLEKDHFHWPMSEAEALEITTKQLEWLLDGLKLENAHKRLEYDRVS